MRNLCLLLCIFCFASRVFATHNKAGEITYRQLANLTYEVTLITYTDTKSPLADRDTVRFEWGDNTHDDIKRYSQTTLPNNTWKNIYLATHTYPGPSFYIIRFYDPNRVTDIENMSNSVNTPFYVETGLNINPFYGYNQSPVLLLPPLDHACTGKLFVHNPSAYDPDGDSLDFSLIPPKQNVGMNVFDYKTPQFSNSFTLNSRTGELIWDTPVKKGIYNIAILIREFRAGKQIGYVTRDMQIVVSSCINNPPVIRQVNDTCIEAGTLLEFPVIATDPDSGDLIFLSATGGPFVQFESPAFINPDPGVGYDSTGTIFHWKTECSHIRKTPYQVVFRAVDDGSPVPLADLEDFNIRVVGPAPRNVQLQQVIDGFSISWNADTCNKAVGYKLYRRIDSSFWKHDYCETGVLGYNNGYQFLVSLNGLNNTSYVDNASGTGLSPGNIYCYMVTAVFISTGANNNAILGTETEGYASEEVCGEIVKSKPVITNVSVAKTDQNSGVMLLAWSKPTVIDSVLYPGPYKYVISRAPGFNGSSFTLLDSLSNPSFGSFNDTMYIDSFVNTVQGPYTYVIGFFSDSLGLKRQHIGRSQTATSVFLTAAPDDQRVLLKWNEFVPWVNDSYVVYRKNGNVFDSIGYSLTKSYVDSNLANGITYCYYVKSVGTFSSPGYVDPVLNNSQEACATPKDTVPSCAPVISAPALDEPSGCIDFRNRLRWNNPNNSCAEDVLQYKVYYKSSKSAPWVLIATLPSANDTFYVDNRDILKRSVAGCYAISTLDSFNNESKKSNEICFDNCPEYVLPNVFSPGAPDQVNDFFIPFPYKFIDHIDLQIFNRWGQLVFSTTDPDINWDGTDPRSGKELGAGVYYYTGRVYEIRLAGISERKLQGTVTLIR